MQQHIALDYVVRVSPLAQRFGDQLRSGRIVGQQCPSCGLVFVPPRSFCPLCVVAMGPEAEVELADTGTVTAFTVLTPIQYHGQKEREDYALGQRPDRRRQRHRRPAAARRRAPRPDPHRHAGRGGVGRPRRSAGASRAIGVRLRQRHPGLAPHGRARRARRGLRGARALMARDVAIVSFAQAPSTDGVEETESQLLFPVIDEAIARSGIDRRSIGFTCSGSADYLAGASFAFVGNLEATGAWPPISESHVEMDGAWALYEAWVRLQHGDIDSALVFSSGISSRGELREVLCLQNDPYYLMPLWADHVSLAALQARAWLDADGRTEADLAEVAARSRRNALGNPFAQVPRRRHGRRHARRAAGRGAAPRRRLPAGVRRGRGDGARGRRPGSRGVRAPGVDPRDRPSHRAALPGRPRPHHERVDAARRRARRAWATRPSRWPSCRPPSATRS